MTPNDPEGRFVVGSVVGQGSAAQQIIGYLMEAGLSGPSRNDCVVPSACNTTAVDQPKTNV
jgi:hypothetical protein